MYRIIIGILLVTLFGGVSFGQSSKMDSLERLYQKASTPGEKVDLALKMGAAGKTPGESLAYAEVAEELAIHQSDEIKIKALSGSAALYFKHSDAEFAVDKMSGAIELLEKKPGTLQLADGYKSLAKYQRRALLFDEALNSYQQAQSIYEKQGDVENVIECMNDRGIIHKDLDNYSEALPIYYEAYDLARQKGLPNKLASTCVNIGVVLKNQRDYNEALTYYKKAEEIYIIDNDYFGLANIYNNIGNVLRIQKKYSEALKYFRLALDNRKKSGKLFRLSYTYNNLGIVYTELHNYKLALENLQEAERLKIKYEDYQTLAHTYLNFSEIYLETNKTKEYYYYADLSEKLARKYGQDEIVRDVIVNHGKFEAKNGNYKKAYGYLSSVFNEIDTMDAKSQKILASVLQAHFRDKQKLSEINELSEENDSLYIEKKVLEDNQNTSRKLIWALSILLIVLIVIFVMLLFKQRALAEKKKELEATNERLRETTLGKEEKETLLKEIHHRVKNNLQIIKSLIRLQKAGVENEKMQSILLEFEQRVSSMALVHEALYKSKDLAKVNVNDYYRDLINDLIDAYNLKQEVKTEISIEVDGLGLDTLVPLGLLTNEIISNSLKHGFAANASGIIKVDLKNIGHDRFELYIGDNGKGFDFEKQREQDNTLGTELILALVEQLDGKYEFSNEGGSYYRITFNSQDKTSKK